MTKVLLVSSQQPHMSALLAALQADGLAVDVVRSSADAMVAVREAETLVVDCGSGCEESRRRFRWVADLLRYRLDLPVVVSADGLSHGQRATLIGLDVAGLYGTSLAPQVLVPWVRHAREGRARRLPPPTNLSLDPSTRVVRLGERMAVLSPREYAVMAVLLETPGEPVTRESLLERVWGDEFAAEWRTVDTTVSRMRHKLELALRARDLVRTVTQRGYLITGAISDGLPGDREAGVVAAPRRCWVVATAAAAWRSCRDSLVQQGEDPVRFVGDCSAVAPGDVLIVIADAQGGWLKQWQALTVGHSRRCGLLLPGSGSGADLAAAAASGNLRLMMPGWWLQDLTSWFAWLNLRQPRPQLNQSTGIDLLLAERAARLRGVTVALAPKDFEVLRVLHRFAGRVVGREQLRQLVWQGSLQRGSRSLDIRISNLRRLIRRHVHGGTPSIETVNGVGYRLHV